MSPHRTRRGPHRWLPVNVRVGRSGPDVEGDPDHVETGAVCGAQQWHNFAGVRAVLGSQVDNGLASVRALEPDQEVAVGVAAPDLGHLLLGVVGGEVDANLGSVHKVCLRFAGIGVDYAAGTHTECKHGIHFGAAGAVETGPKLGEHTEESRIGIAFYGIVRSHVR